MFGRILFVSLLAAGLCRPAFAQGGPQQPIVQFPGSNWRLAPPPGFTLSDNPTPAQAAGAPGSYAIVFDAAGEPIAGTYWIAPEVRVVMQGHRRPGSGAPALPSLTPTLMDREFLPRRQSIDPLFLLLRFDHSPGPTVDMLKLGSPATSVRTDFSPSFSSIQAMGLKPEPAAVPETRAGSVTFKLTLLSSQVLILGDTRLTAHMLETRSENPEGHPLIPPVRALLLAETGMLIDQDRFDPPARIERGALTSSADFISYFEMLAYRTKLPATAACLERKRRTDAFKAASTVYRDIVDAYTAKSFPLSSLSYVMAKGITDIEAQIQDTAPHLLCPP